MIRYRQLPPEKLWGFNFTVPDTDWWQLIEGFDADGYFNNWIVPQAVASANAGANYMRWICCLKAASDGDETLSQWIAQNERVARLCLSLGMYFSIATEEPAPERTLMSFGDIISDLPPLCNRLANYPNFIGTSLVNEPSGLVGYGVARSDLDSYLSEMIAGCRLAAPNMVIGTEGYTDGSYATAPFSDPSILNHVNKVDAFFVHGYAPVVSPAIDDFYALPGTAGKPFIVEEFGSPASAGSAAQTAIVTAQAYAINHPMCRGSAMWAAADQGTSDTDSSSYGAFDSFAGFAPVPALITPYQSYSHGPSVIRSPGPRRRR